MKKILVRENLISFFIFLALIAISTLIFQNIAQQLTFGCATSPYSDFKTEYCGGVNAHKGEVRILGKDWVSQPTTLIRIAAIELLPIYDDHEFWIEHPFTFMSIIFPITGHVQFNLFSTADSNNTAKQITNIIFTILDILFVFVAAITLTYLWKKKSKAKKITAILLLLLMFKYLSLLTLPISLLFRR